MDEGESINRGAEPPWERVRRWYRALRRRLSLRPSGLTPADVVPPGALPICPACILPHHPMTRLCPECGEIVSPYATMMPFVWIFVWGPKLQRVVRQERLSRLLWVGLLVSAFDLLGKSAGGYGMVMVPSGAPDYGVVFGVLHWFVLAAVYLGAAFQMIEAAVQKWGTWREEAAEEPSGD